MPKTEQLTVLLCLSVCGPSKKTCVFDGDTKHKWKVFINQEAIEIGLCNEQDK